MSSGGEPRRGFSPRHFPTTDPRLLYGDARVLVYRCCASGVRGSKIINNQKHWELQKTNQRIAKLLESYADEDRRKSLTDDNAKKLIYEAVAIEQAEANLKSTFAPKLSKALPIIKVARYLQIDNKFRAVNKYDIAQGVPLVP